MSTTTPTTSNVGHPRTAAAVVTTFVVAYLAATLASPTLLAGALTAIGAVLTYSSTARRLGVPAARILAAVAYIAVTIAWLHLH